MFLSARCQQSTCQQLIIHIFPASGNYITNALYTYYKRFVEALQTLCKHITSAWHQSHQNLVTIRITRKHGRSNVLELERSGELNREWTEIATRHQLVLDVLGFILRNKFCTGNTTLGTCLVEEVNYRTA